MSGISSLGTSCAAAGDADAELCAWRTPPPTSPLPPCDPTHLPRGATSKFLCASARRRVRSRSSPVRWYAAGTTEVSATEYYARSPSVSPPRPASPVAALPLDGRGGAMGAYFSARVPVEPVRLVPVHSRVSGPVPENSDLQKIYDITKNIYSVGNVVPDLCALSLTRVAAPGACLDDSAADSAAACPSLGAIVVEKRKSPVTLAASSPTAGASASACRDVAVQVLCKTSSTTRAAPDSKRLVYSTGPRRQRRDRTSAAKQVLNAIPYSPTVRAGAGCAGCEGCEWVGGVRALRDSHVKLVLRELRHIERLNRALDDSRAPC